MQLNNSVLQRQSAQEDNSDYAKYSVDDRSSLLSIPKHHQMSQQQQTGKAPATPLLLLKPNGAPIFQSSDKMKQNQSQGFNMGDSTLDQTIFNAAFDSNGFSQAGGIGNTVRAHSFVVGKKVCNQTSIDLLTAETGPNVGEERPNPIKVIYVKSTLAQKEPKPSSQPPPSNKGKKQPSNVDNQGKQKTLKLKKHSESPSQAQLNQKSTGHEKKELKINNIQLERPKSANPNTENQAPNQQRLHSAPSKQNLLKKKLPTDTLSSRFPEPQPPATQQTINVPFAENRLKGQFESFSKDLVKRAHDTLVAKRQEHARQKEEAAAKRERQKELEDQIKRENQEKVQRQKERGAEHIDFRQREEELKEVQRKQENKREREQQKELRKRRKVDREVKLGLDGMDEAALEEHRRGARERLQAEEAARREARLQAEMQRPKSSKQQRYNDDLRGVNGQGEKSPERNVPQQQEEEDPQIVALKKAMQKQEREAILKEQKRRRREQELDRQLKEQQEKAKIEDNLRRLKDELEIQKIANLEMQRKAKEEREQTKKVQKSQEQRGNAKKRVQRVSIPQASEEEGLMMQTEEYEDLHEWIEEQVHKSGQQSANKAEQAPRGRGQGEEKKERSQSGPRGGALKQGSQERTSSGLDLNDVINLNYGNGDFVANQIIPGNNEIDHADFSKYGQRQNRYGIYGDNGYQDHIEIHKRAPATIKQAMQARDKSVSPDSNQVILSKETLVSAFQRIQEYHQDKVAKTQPPELDYSLTNIETRQPSVIAGMERKILNQIHRDYAGQLEAKVATVPGVVRIESEVQRLKREELELNTKAVTVIQKWTRGFLARQYTRKVRERRARDIEAEYGYFRDQVKFSSDYNLKKFLRDKERLRDNNKTKSLAPPPAIHESDSIIERIGDSSTGSRIPIMSKVAPSVSQSLGRAAVKRQNFFQAPDRDPNSIINIMIQKSLPKPAAAVQSPVKFDRVVNPSTKQEKSGQKPKEQKKSKIDIKPAHHRDEIEEDIISENIEGEDGSKTISNRSNNADSSIDEDIILSASGKGGQSSESNSKENVKPFQQLRGHKPFEYRQHSSIGESIQEDLIGFSMDKRGVSNRKLAGSGSYDAKQSSGSIPEDLQLAEQSRGSSNRDKRNSSAIEESIHESVISEDGGSQSLSSSAVMAKNKAEMNARQQQRQVHQTEKEKTMKQIEEFRNNLQMDKEKREQLISELVGELNRYESASLQTLFVERMEKIISKSLAQKDQIFLAQRLHEMDMEKRHKEEIVRIREEQIKLMAQLMLAGGIGSGAPGTGLSEKERKDMIDSLQKIIEKPIIIKQDSSRNVVGRQSANLSKLSEKSSSIKESMNVRSDLDEDEIVDEIGEPSIADDVVSEEIKESIPEESQQLTQVRRAIGSEDVIRKQSQQAVKDATGKSPIKKLTGGPFQKNTYSEYIDDRFKHILLGEAQGSHDMVHQLSKQIEIFKAQAELELDHDLHRNIITPRTYRKKGEDLEKWASTKKHEIAQKLQPLNDQYQSIMNGLKREKEMIFQKIGVSPRHTAIDQSGKFKDSSSLSYREIEDDLSGESDRMKNARDQIYRLAKKDNTYLMESQIEESGVSTKVTHDIKKKKALAKKLIEEKERVINQGLKSKIHQIEAEQAERILKVAMELDPAREIERRMREMKRQIEESGADISESGRSVSMSQSYAPSESMGTKKKNVRFEPSPDQNKFRSAGKDDVSSQGSSPAKKPQQRGKQSLIEDSIGESMEFIEESVPDSALLSGSQKNNNSTKSPKGKLVDSIPESIGERIQSSQGSNYSEDFDQSHAADPSRQSEESKYSTPGRKQFSNHLHTDPDAEVIDESQSYSQNFDASQSMPNSAKNKQAPVIVVNNEDKQDQDEDDQAVVSSQQDDVSGIPISQTISFNGTSVREEPNPVDPDDKEIVQSSKSIDWLFDLRAQEKQAPPPKEGSPVAPAEDEDEEDSSDSDDDFLDKVELIVEEFMGILVSDVQDDPTLVINAKAHDEEDFADKFPFKQLREEEEERERKRREDEEERKRQQEINRVQQMQVKITGKRPDELAREKYDKEVKELQARNQNLENYLNLLISNIDRKELQDVLEKPIDTDPLKKLAFIFSHEAEDLQVNESMNPNILLSLDFFTKIEQSFRQKYPRAPEEEEKVQAQHDTWHHKALFDAFNIALDMERPYKEKGQPLPWSKQIRVVRKKLGSKDLEKMLEKAKSKVIEWFKSGAGTNIVPPPPPPPASQEEGAQPPPIASDQDRLNQIKEERLGLLMVKDLEENEHNWIDYEDEDTMAKLDLADMILDVLSQEVAEFLNAKSGA